MSNALILNQSQVLSGLGTMTYTVPTGAGGAYNVAVQCTELPPSGISIVVNQNGTPEFTAPAVSATQGALQFKFSILLAAADVVTVVLSSSNANDNLMNTVKSEISIGQGF